MSRPSAATSERVRELTETLLAWPSVTGSDGERTFGPRLRDELATWPVFADRPDDLWLQDAGDGRSTVCALVRGAGTRAVVLAGHYDVVPPDHGADRTAIVAALRERGQPADLRAIEDLASEKWLPGRGALDMKSGLAAALAILEVHDPATGSLLLLACPDEEGLSAGARVAPRALTRTGLDVVLGINMDVVTDEGDGTYGRSVFGGGVGKILLCALVRGCPAHAGDPLAGLSAHALAAEVVRELEGQPGFEPLRPPPVLLHAGDTKTEYDVTMPRDVLLVFNLLLHDLTPDEALARFAVRVAGALDAAVARWPGRDVPQLEVTVGDVPESSEDPVAVCRAALPDQAGGPGAVVALGPVRYPAVPWTGTLPVAGPYPHPSDMSFLADGVVPWVNAGPWGRDFHQLGERVFAPYVFGELPGVLEGLVQAALRPPPK